MWLSGQGFIVILLSDSFRIELRYYISVALKAFARFCLWEHVKQHFSWISGHKRLWPVSAAASVPCALKEAVAQHPAAQPAGCSRPGLQEKIPGRFRIFPSELGWDVKQRAESWARKGFGQQDASGWCELERAFVSLTVGRVTARWQRNPRAGEEILTEAEPMQNSCLHNVVERGVKGIILQGDPARSLLQVFHVLLLLNNIALFSVEF